MNRTVAALRKESSGSSVRPFDPYDGFRIADMKAVLEEYAASSLVLDTQVTPEIPAYEFAYLLVESGIPTLIGFYPCGRDGDNDGEKDDGGNDGDDDIDGLHVMPLVGHTMNSDEWLPMARAFYEEFDEPGLDTHPYVASAAWASHLVIQDDELGPYLCLGARDLTEGYSRTHESQGGKGRSRIRYVIGIVAKAEKYTIHPYFAQHLAATVFWKKWQQLLDNVAEPWQTRLRHNPFAAKNLVLRTQKVDRDDYIQHLRDQRDHALKKSGLGRKESARLRRTLPKRFWMTEFSIPELFSVNRSKLGEILTKFAPSMQELTNFGSEKDPTLCLGFRFINHFELRKGAAIQLRFRSHCTNYRRRQTAPEY
jgi:hypothetical protein